MRPMARHLLIHTVTYKPQIQEDAWGHTYGEPVVVKRVRIEPKDNVAQGLLDKQTNYRYRLYWDKVLSTPCEFSLEGKVIFEGQEMTITEIRKLHDNVGLHHLEIHLL